jgi:hypothetical protein
MNPADEIWQYIGCLAVLTFPGLLIFACALGCVLGYLIAHIL